MSDVRPSNFIADIIARDLKSGRHTRVVTRFPPEPNGYLHIGHAKAIHLNFGLARDFGGVCHLRMDDTNPQTEDPEYVGAIQEDLRWLGVDWGDHLFYASDKYEALYAIAEHLVMRGKAYVCPLTEAQMREYRGSLTEPGRPSPSRDHSPQENLALLRRMRAGEFEDGALTLRAKIDMAAPNLKLRDPPMYRIRHAHHYRQGDGWCIYPLYDFAHGLSDALEGVTHSICTLEFENNRPVYDFFVHEARQWFAENTDLKVPPKQYEFARLHLSYTVMSKRKLLRLVKEGYVKGWDDPRMPTIAALRRRGVTSQAIAAFADMIGVAKNNSLVDIDKLEWAIRDDLNAHSPRVMAVLDPLEVVLTGADEGVHEQLEAPLFPHDIPLDGSRTVPFDGTLYIERADFMEEPERRFRRLAPGRVVRLRHAHLVRCDAVEKDETGRILRLRCSLHRRGADGREPDIGKVHSTIHWVSKARSLRAEVRLYDRLFNVARPGADGADFLTQLNPGSLVSVSARVEPWVASAAPGARFQFERQGYFCLDTDSSQDGLVFNRTVTLKDSWTQKAAPASRKPAPRRSPPKPASKVAPAKARDLLAEDPSLAAFHAAAVRSGASKKGARKWIRNALQRVLKNQPLDRLPFDGATFGELVALVEDGTLSSRSGKQVLDAMLDGQGSPRQIIDTQGLRQVSDSAALDAAIDAVLAEHPAEWARYRDGAQNLFGFFVGQVMGATRGQANPKRVTALLREKLG